MHGAAELPQLRRGRVLMPLAAPASQAKCYVAVTLLGNAYIRCVVAPFGRRAPGVLAGEVPRGREQNPALLHQGAGQAAGQRLHQVCSLDSPLCY